MPRALRQRAPALIGAAALTVLLLTIFVIPQAARALLRDTAFDLVLDTDRRLWTAQQSDSRIVVVDIDRPSIEAFGAWPWPRLEIARLVEAVAEHRPAAIAIDVLFAEPDDLSPAALARRLGALADRADI